MAKDEVKAPLVPDWTAQTKVSRAQRAIEVADSSGWSSLVRTRFGRFGGIGFRRWTRSTPNEHTKWARGRWRFGYSLRIMRRLAIFSALLSATIFACTTFGTGVQGPVGTDAADADRISTDAGDAAPSDAAKRLGPFCADAGDVSFCDEFDRAQPRGDWTRTNQTQGSTLVIPAGGGILQASVPNSSGSADSRGFARLEKRIPRADLITLELDVAVDTIPLAQTQVLAIQFVGSASISLVIQGTDAGSIGALVGQTFDPLGAETSSFSDRLPGIKAGMGFQRFRLALDLKKGRVSLLVDGQPVLPEKPLGLTIPATPPEVTAMAGVVYADPATTCLLRVRNVVFDVRASP